MQLTLAEAPAIAVKPARVVSLVRVATKAVYRLLPLSIAKRLGERGFAGVAAGACAGIEADPPG